MKVKSETIFDPGSAPYVAQELSLLKAGVAKLPDYLKADMIISYLKDHSMNNDWIRANPEMMETLLSHRFITRNIEAQFNYCRTKPAYRLDYEAYIRQFLRGTLQLHGYVY